MDNEALRAVVGEVVREVVRAEIAPLEARVGGMESAHARLAAEVGKISDQQEKTAAVISAVNSAAMSAGALAQQAMKASNESKEAIGIVNTRTAVMARELGVPDDDAQSPGRLTRSGQKTTALLVGQVVVFLAAVAQIVAHFLKR